LELDHTIPIGLLPTTRKMVIIFVENTRKAKKWEKKHEEGREGKHKKKKKL